MGASRLPESRGLKVSKLHVVIPGDALELCKAGSAAEPPAEILVLPKGEIRVQDAPPLLMDEEAARMVLAAFKVQSHDMVVDYEHQTMREGEAPAAGWIKALDWRPEDAKPGLYAKVEWTARAADLLRAKEYRYHSPVLVRDKASGRVKYLHNVALTNQPRMLDAPALAAKYTLQIGGEDMDPKKLKELLGMDAAADEAAVLKAIADLKAGKDKAEGELTQLKAKPNGKDVVACKEVLAALGLDDGSDKAKVLGALESLKAPAAASGELAKTVESLKAELGGIKADGLVHEALQTGRTSPAEVDAWGRKMAAEQPEMFKQVVLSRPEGSVVPLKATKTVEGQGDSGELSPEQRKINEQLGVTDEVWLKHNPKKAEGC